LQYKFQLNLETGHIMCCTSFSNDLWNSLPSAPIRR